MTTPAVVYPVILAAIHAFVALPAFGGGLRAGSPTASEAAAPNLGPPDVDGRGYAYALGDTIGYDFPEEDKKSTTQLIKEVALWVVVAGFIAYFIIEVFLQGDTDETDEGGSGKPLPPGAFTHPQPAPPQS